MCTYLSYSKYFVSKKDCVHNSGYGGMVLAYATFKAFVFCVSQIELNHPYWMNNSYTVALFIINTKMLHCRAIH